MAESASYATQVIQVLREYFPDLNDPETVKVVTDLIQRHARDSQVPFEVIVDDPQSARWQLKVCSDDRRRFVLTEAPGEFAARHRGEAEDEADPRMSIRLAETAERALDLIEEAMTRGGENLHGKPK